MKITKLSNIPYEECQQFYKSDEWKNLRKKLFKERIHENSKCVYCNIPFRDIKATNINLDHRLPLKFYWDRRLDEKNLQFICESCNKIKGNNTNFEQELSHLNMVLRERSNYFFKYGQHATQCDIDRVKRVIRVADEDESYRQGCKDEANSSVGIVATSTMTDVQKDKLNYFLNTNTQISKIYVHPQFNKDHIQIDRDIKICIESHWSYEVKASTFIVFQKTKKDTYKYDYYTRFKSFRKGLKQSYSNIFITKEGMVTNPPKKKR